MLKNKPWLLQRCSIRTPFGDKNLNGVNQTLALDYMGAAEYEFGAVPESCQRIMDNVAEYQVIKTQYTDLIGRPLFMIGRPDVCEAYREYLPGVLDGTRRMKERTDLPDLFVEGRCWLPNPKPHDPELLRKFRDRYLKTRRNNIAWDIDNDVILIFASKKYAIGVLEAFINSAKNRRDNE